MYTYSCMHVVMCMRACLQACHAAGQTAYACTAETAYLALKSSHFGGFEVRAHNDLAPRAELFDCIKGSQARSHLPRLLLRICMYVCMHACMCVCVLRVFMYVCMPICVCVCVHVFMYVCTYASKLRAVGRRQPRHVNVTMRPIHTYIHR